MLEVGCGVGNFVFPLLEQNKAVRVYACDFAKHAVELVKVRGWRTTRPCSTLLCVLTAAGVEIVDRPMRCTIRSAARHSCAT